MLLNRTHNLKFTNGVIFLNAFLFNYFRIIHFNKAIRSIQVKRHLTPVATKIPNHVLIVIANGNIEKNTIYKNFYLWYPCIRAVISSQTNTISNHSYFLFFFFTNFRKFEIND